MTLRPNVSVVHYGPIDNQFVDTLEKGISVFSETPPSAGGATPDTLYRTKKLQHVALLTIASISDVPEVAEGCKSLLKHARIDWLLLPDACYLPGILPDPTAQLLHQNFVRVTVDPNGGLLAMNRMFDPLIAGHHILVNTRIAILLHSPETRLAQRPILDEVMEAYGLKPTGVMHVGANMGQEVSYYRDRNYGPVVLIEANPDLAGYLLDKVKSDAGYYAVNVAATDQDGPITLNITGNSQGSSILAPSAEGIAEWGQDFNVQRQVTVPGRRLDGVVDDLKLELGAFSLLHLDIQGAEGMALRGSKALLQHVEVVLSEINFTENYEGCSQIEEIDDLLEAAGFTRVAIDCTYSASWGDGIYVRNSLLPA
ncbi:FkbM family methyltransferase [Lacibacterium aquatile]|uniref:FkbM family methyltransferase n=1 Tax=Lacibacterium aquatile TaxID=1168082 RepID=A0ABW5DT46_9PROT